MNEKITFTAQEMQAESARCIEAQQARIQAILKQKSEEIRKKKWEDERVNGVLGRTHEEASADIFGEDKGHIAFLIATNNQRMNEMMKRGESIKEIAESNRALLHALNLYDAEEYSYTDTL